MLTPVEASLGLLQKGVQKYEKLDLSNLLKDVCIILLRPTTLFAALAITARYFYDCLVIAKVLRIDSNIARRVQ